MFKLLFAVILATSVSSFAETKMDRKPNQQTSLDLDSVAAKTVGDLLRKANQKGNKSVVFSGGPQVTTYSVGNLSCYYQNSDDSVSCTVGQ